MFNAASAHGARTQGEKPMSFSIERSAEASTVRIANGLAADDRAELRRAVLGELADGTQVLRFDFAGASELDAASLGLMVSLSRLAREHSVELRLANLNDELRMLFALTKLDDLFIMEVDEGGEQASPPADLPSRPVTAARPNAEEERPRP
jgi:anti-sigma B factor antagonist